MHRLSLYTLLFCVFLPLSVHSQTINSNKLLKELLDLPAPPPVQVEPEETKSKERPEEFYSDENVPPDDAPVEDLLDYWAQQSEGNSRLRYQMKPSAKTAERILEACDSDPEKLAEYLPILPSDAKTGDAVKRIYDSLQENNETEAYTRNRLREWLKYNSNHFSGELVREAQKIKDKNNYVENAHQDVLLALAKVDWDAARSIIDRLELDSSQPYSQTLAKWAQYAHAIETEDSGATEKYRRMLKDIVENKSADWRLRDLAMDALAASGDWDGRDEWYVSLLADETLLTIQDNGNTGLTTLIATSPPKKWTERMLELVKSENFAVRSAAVRNLMDSPDGKRKDVLQALLPWLANPNWAKPSRNGERGKLIAALGEIDVPESVPSLIAIVMNEEESRAAAVAALLRYKDSRAIPALKFALSKENVPPQREGIIKALIASGGFSDDEQMAALEAYATMISTPEGTALVNFYQYGYYSHRMDETGEAESKLKPLPIEISIGKTVGEQEEPSDGLVSRTIERVKILKRTNPAVSAVLVEIMQKWKGRAIFMEFLRQIRAGEADVNTILSALAAREEIREKVPSDLMALRSASGAPRGISACLLEDASEYASVLNQTDVEARIAMLGCARLLRAELRVDEVAGFLNDSNKLLALAAERWLESEDGFEARKLVLAKHPDKALILGARLAFVPEKNSVERSALSELFESVTGTGYWATAFSGMEKNEEKLRDEIKSNPDLIAVYAVFGNAESGQQIIRVYKNKVVYTFEEDEARYWEKTLTDKEYEHFYNFLIARKIDSLPPFNMECDHCESSEFVMFGRGGGRRVFLSSGVSEKSVLGELFAIFEEHKKENLALRYRFADKIKGLEILLADKHLEARAVWKKDTDLRVLIEDKLKQEEIAKELAEFHRNLYSTEINEENQEQKQALYETLMKKQRERLDDHFSWRSLQNGKLGSIASQPAEVPVLSKNTNSSPDPGVSNSNPSWQVRAGNLEIRAGEVYEGGLYKTNGAAAPVKIKEGLYANPVITPDGKWAIATKAETDWSEPKTIVRVNLQTGREYKIAVAPSDAFYPVAFLGSHNKILLYRGKGHFLRIGAAALEGAESVETEPVEEALAGLLRANAKPNPSPKTAEYYLLDANTGAAQLVKGDFRPLVQQTERRLQPTAVPGEFWAAVYDEKTKQTNIGRYNEKTFVFQPITKIPDINLNSMNIWIDEKEAKIYFVYLGHLLSIPL